MVVKQQEYGDSSSLISDHTFISISLFLEAAVMKGQTADSPQDQT